MSESSVVYGRILCRSAESIKKNIEVVSQLPPTAEYSSPYFTGEMFNRNMASGKYFYAFGFARAYKNIEHLWEQWIDEFERLLVKMEWTSVYVILETEMFGTHQYSWIDKKYYHGEKNNANMIEKENWFFGKGYRNFWGMDYNYGWETEKEEVKTLSMLLHSFQKTINRNDGYLNLSAIDDKNLEIRANKQGIKLLIADLITAYVNSMDDKRTLPRIRELFAAGEYKIGEIKLTDDPNNTDWIHDFVDKLIDAKKKDSDTGNQAS